MLIPFIFWQHLSPGCIEFRWSFFLELINVFLVLQVCPFKKMAHRHHYESPDNSTYKTKKPPVPLKPLIMDSILFSVLIIIQVLTWVWQISSNLAIDLLSYCSFSFTANYLFAFLIAMSAHPYRREATCEMILFPTSSSSSPTVWRCMPTRYRDFTKHCWMTSPRYEQFCFGPWLDVEHLHLWNIQSKIWFYNSHTLF